MSAYALHFFPTKAQETNSVNQKDQNPIRQNDSKEALKSDSNNRIWTPNDVLISIISAGIDPIRLIQDLTKSSRHNNSTNNTSTCKSGGIRIREKIYLLSNSIANSLSTGPMEQKRKIREHSSIDEESLTNETLNFDNPFDSSKGVVRKHENHLADIQYLSNGNDKSTATDSSRASQHNEAIQFTLSISFNGRNYEATRALQSFINLRKALMKELSNRKGCTLRHYSHDIRSEKQCISNDNQELVVIPELPIGNDRKSSRLQDLEHGALAMVGMVGSGFRGLQAAVCAYKPQMEKWIQSVAALVPSSPSLANFLWEPLEDEELQFTFTSLKNSPTSSFRNSLSSIQECSDCDSDDDSFDYEKVKEI